MLAKFSQDITMPKLTTACLLMVLLTDLTSAIIHPTNRVIVSDQCSPSCPVGWTCIEILSICRFPRCPRHRICVLGEVNASPTPAPETTPLPPGCPAPQFNTVCISQCRDNGDCTRGHVCCPTSCGRSRCMADTRIAREDKLGTCPRYLPDSRPETCTNQCSDDHDCPGSKKCCSSGCSKKCVNPCHFYPTSTFRRPWQTTFC